MEDTRKDEIRRQVRQAYGQIAVAEQSCCSGSSCCDSTSSLITVDSVRLGYTADELRAAPVGADLGLGCGNPQAIADLRMGETVLDLGSGAGFDCFLAAAQVGPTGLVIGVDMTPEMVSKARANAEKGGYANVEFRLGEIERLPVADATVDVIISNCVINLSPDKSAVFAEAHRVLKPGGRLAISDVVTFADIPAALREDTALYSGCVTGAAHLSVIEQLLAQAGFEEVAVEPKEESRDFMADWAPGTPITDYVVSASIRAVKAT
jgi:arsenite methyltransferase